MGGQLPALPNRLRAAYAHGTVTNNKEKLKTKTEYSSDSEETVRAIVHEGNPEGRSEITREN